MKRRKLRIGRLLVITFIFVIGLCSIIILINKNDESENNNTSNKSKCLKIELIGDKDIVLTKDSEYIEFGAKAYCDTEEISDQIKINSEVDMNKAGTYEVKYSISYKEEKKDIIRTIEIVDSNIENGIVGTTSKGYKIEKKAGIYYINGILIANKTYPLPSSYNPGDLLDVFKDNFNKMKNDAASQGINLNVISGFRSYTRQQTLYNNYVSRDGKEQADTYSARPGHSEHQTGLAADINSLSQSWENTNEGKWLNNNCYKYGFIIRYVKGKEDITGYIFEPWHIRYVGNDLASKLYNNGDWITLEEYLGVDSKY